jgi:hypothetical protein
MPRPGSVVWQGREGTVRHTKFGDSSPLGPMHPQTPECIRSLSFVRPWWRCMRARGDASWPHRAASHKRFHRAVMFGHVLETAARPAACWSAARPREATSTTSMLISPPPALGRLGLSRLLLGASRLWRKLLPSTHPVSKFSIVQHHCRFV